MPGVGTRTRQNFQYGHPPSEMKDRGFTRDVGMSKNITASFTYTASNGRITGVAGNFANFAVNDDVIVNGTNLNNGDFNIVAIAGDTSWIQLDLPVKNEGPLSSTVRTE